MESEYAEPDEESQLVAAVGKVAARVIWRLMRHRERYVRAWIAETGVLPSDAVIIEQNCSDGKTKIWVERKDAIGESYLWKVV